MTQVIIAGAGLAGLTVAKVLAQRGMSVTLLDAAERVGGKAGADMEEGVLREHGYHIFPTWYVNTHEILKELGIPMVHFDAWNYLRESERDRPITVPVPRSLPTLLQTLKAGVYPWQEVLLYGYQTVDTLAEPMAAASLLDQVSRIGLLRSRWYVTDWMPEFEQENILKASAIPAYDMSAMTVKVVMNHWIRHNLPFLSILPGNLQTVFIEPYAARVAAAGAQIRLCEPVFRVETEGDRVKAFITRSPDGQQRRYTGDVFVFATPVEITRKLISGKMQDIDPELGNFERLHAVPMASLHLDLDRKLSWIPKEHIVLSNSRYGLTFLDLSHHWPGVSKSTLSFISSNFLPLQDLSPTEQFEALYGEITRYMNIHPSMIEGSCLKANVNFPLFINTVGAWTHRPRPRAQLIPNLYFAGDWARNPVDLACMEGAVSSALGTARELAADCGIPDVPGPQTAKAFPELMFRALKWALLPGVVPLWAYCKLRRRLAT